MNGNDLSRQLSHLPEEMIAEAMAPAEKTHKKNRTLRVLRIAACFAVVIGLLTAALGLWPSNEGIITEQGLLTIRVQALEPESGAIYTEYLDSSNFFQKRPQLSTFSNTGLGIPLFLSMDTADFPAEKITFDISVSSGVYMTELIGENLPAKCTVDNNTEVYWNFAGWYQSDHYGESWYSSEHDRVFTTIIIRSEGNIIGYAVYRFDRIYSEETWDSPLEALPTNQFWLELVASVAFPKVDGAYQEITEEYVKECITNVCN